MTGRYLVRVVSYACDPVAKSTRQRQVATATTGEDKRVPALSALRDAGIELRGDDDIMGNVH